MLAKTKSWTNIWVDGDLRCHDAHCDVSVMLSFMFKPLGAETRIFEENKVNTVAADALWPLLLTWFNFNPSMDK